MDETLKPAAALAARMDRPAAGASAEYLAARQELLVAEIELRRQTEQVAALRRALPPGPAVARDYEFVGLGPDDQPMTLRLSDLFREGSRSLVVYCYMFPRHKADTRMPAKRGEIAMLPAEQQPCPSCTGLLDQLDAAAPHFEAAGGNFVAVANVPLEQLLMVARDRGWRNLRLLSSAGNGFKRAYHAEDPDGQQQPMTLVFERDERGVIRLFWASDLVWAPSDPHQDHRAAGTLEPFWNLFDLTRGGRPDFNEQLDYSCCSVGKAGE